ncbi:Major cardiolipin synthase ClsA [compost metagenome]
MATLISPTRFSSAPTPASRPARASAGQELLSKWSPEVDRLLLGAATTRNAISYHLSPEESRVALLDAIRSAKNSFHIETFIWHNDEAGNEIVDALAAKKREAAREGREFDAKVLIDSIGLRGGSNGAKDSKIVDKLEAAGIEVRIFNSRFVSLEALGVPITHRKLYIADGEKFITGGRNIGNEYLKPTFEGSQGEEASWHDLLYTVDGDEAARVQREFYQNWSMAGGEVPEILPEAKPHATGAARVLSIVTNPHADVFSIRQAHSKAIANAQREIVAIFPYFSDDKLIADLISAKEKNAERRATLAAKARNPQEREAFLRQVPELSIKVLLPGKQEAGSGGLLYPQLNMETARQLLEAGIEVRLYEGKEIDGQQVQQFSHFKGMAIDGKLLSLGSANADARTYGSNHELNTLIADEKAVKEFYAKVVEPDWRSARPVTLDELGQTPWYQRTWRKVLEALDFLF